MSKSDPVPVPNRYRYRIYQTGYFFGTDSIPTFDIFGTGPVLVRYGTGIYQFLPSNTGTKPNRVYLVPVPVPTFGDFRHRFFRYRYRSVPSSSLIVTYCCFTG
ncbi:hypothetical protein Hanom_Chr12g01163631 [Helianthus anomalus]